MMNVKLIAVVLLLAWAGLASTAAHAQSSTSSCTSSNVTESFTGATTNCSWYFIGGACLTAGSTTTTTSPGQLPSCTSLTGAGKYYNGVTLDGGNTGTLPDTTAQGGALRLTNDSNNESGAIISNSTYALNANGLQVTFSTETYSGDSGSNSYGGDSDGADGISFFLQDASATATPTLGDFGGSLGYTCSNVNNSANQGYDGMIGAYIGLGIDDYGNFLDGSWVMPPTGTTGSAVFNPSAQGAGTTNGIPNPQDNTASGYGKQANRIGLRGAGSVAWSWLSTNTTPTTTLPNGPAQYYPTTLTSAQRLAAVQQTCETGFVWDYSHVTASTADSTTRTWIPTTPAPGTGSQSIANPYNATPMPALTLNDYQAIQNGYAVLPITHLIAKESATKRGYSTSTTNNSSSTTTAAQYGVPITYNLTISPAGLLSLSYSYNGGNFQPVLVQQSIVNNGSLPTNVRFGFAASTGGSNNIHEIMCFQASPQNSASSSAGLNQKQTAKVQTGTQVYFAFYNPSNWTGDVTSQYLQYVSGNSGPVEIAPAVNWDASCVLTGAAASATCATNAVAETPDAGTASCGVTGSSGSCTRQIWSWNGTNGIPFTWGSTSTPSLTSTQQTDLNIGTVPAPSTTASSTTEPANAVLEYLRGVRTHEQNAQGVDPTLTATTSTPVPNPSGFRARTSVLGDVVDSSPTWVGPPSASFPATWTDLLYPTETLAENSGPTYANFETTYAGRMNVVYTGANDGLLHGFRTGYFTNGAYAGTTTNGNFTATNNDGEEVLAYMPGYVVNSINGAEVAGSTTPNYVLDYPSPQYAHKFSVDGTPGTGDLYYGTPPAGAWHTWLVGGLGAGGSAIYALDITNPANFLESNASTGVIGEWSSSLTTTTSSTTGATTVTGYTSNLTCQTNANGGAGLCGGSLGKTYGTPQIRRFHNNPASGGPTTSWGVVFGNGSGSYNGDAGIFVMLVNNTGAPSFYYLSTGVGSRTTTPNGIYYVTPADLDGDHVTDYVYAGDLQGNVWRFDLTSSNPAQWAVTGSNGIAVTSSTKTAGVAIYNTGSTSVPITTQVIVASVAGAGGTNPRILVEFGTGEQTPFTNNTSATYSTAQQYLIGVWDWNLSGNPTGSGTTPVAHAWNTISTVQYASLPSGGLSAPGSPPLSGVNNLQQQTIQSTSAGTTGTYDTRTVTNYAICWPGTTGCTGPQYGWYLQLSSGNPNSSDVNMPLSSTTPEIYEQVIFSPTLQDGAFIVNTTIPPTTSLSQCSSTSAGGWTMVLNAQNGGAFPTSVFTSNGTTGNNNQNISGLALSGTGTPSLVSGSAGTATNGTTPGGSLTLVSQTVSNIGVTVPVTIPSSVTGSRVTWIERR